MVVLIHTNCVTNDGLEKLNIILGSYVVGAVGDIMSLATFQFFFYITSINTVQIQKFPYEFEQI